MRRCLSVVAAALVALVAAVPADDAGPRRQYHRDGFSGRQPVWQPGPANVKVREIDHRIVNTSFSNAPASEYLKIDAQPNPGKADAEFAHYVYDTPKCPVSPGPAEEATARVWLKAFRGGIQLRARVRLPKERDPENPEQELATYIVGDSYPDERVRQWHPLSIRNPSEALDRQLPVLRLKLKRDVDKTGAYIDQLVLNVYAGPGVTEMWIDDLDIGPCIPEPRKPGRVPATPAVRTPGSPVATDDPAHPYTVEFAGGRILIDKKPFFMRAIRYSGTPLKDLRDANFNTVAFPADASPELIDEAIRQNFLLVPGVPSVSDSPNAADRDADRLAEHFKRFRQGDGVLMWDFGGGRTAEQVRTVSRAGDALREYDPRRPRAVNAWDGFGTYSENLDAIGAHRFPLFTSLPLANYRDWMKGRRALIAPGKLMWTWVQTHTPDWLGQLAGDVERDRGGKTVARGQAPDAAPFPGPHPEQIRLLTYLSLASGCRGIGFWSDQALTNPALGRDRLLELFQLNCELELLEPFLFTADDDPVKWLPTSHGAVQAAVIRGKHGVLVLPVWLGDGSQHCPDQGTVERLTFTVPLVPDGADPWLITPAGYDNLRVAGGTRPLPGGVQVTLPTFDLTAAVVFTTDHSGTGLVARWQDNIQNKYARPAAKAAREQAVETYEKAKTVHEQLVTMGTPPVPMAAELFEKAQKAIRRADYALDNAQPDQAYREARAALRPLRIVMREHWKQAVAGLTAPTASPFAVSYFTLPQHYRLADRVRPPARFGPNVLPHGGFELSEPAPADGAGIRSLPGWSDRESHLDAVLPSTAVVNVDEKVRAEPKPGRPKPGEPITPAYQPPAHGKHCLRLKIEPAKPKDGVAAKKPTRPPTALERAMVAVDSPVLQLQPGAWARVSFSMYVPGVSASADGAMVFDSAGGEPLAVRSQGTGSWVRHHLYRPVPADGQFRLTFALTGLGEAYFDDVRVEVLE